MARDPRYRPFRIALWVVYLTVVAISIGLTIRGVVRNLRGAPRPSATLPTRTTVRVCLSELEGLNREQHEQTWRLGSDLASGADAVDRWSIWSRKWEQRIEDLADRCRLDVADADADAKAYPERRELAAARDAVVRVHRGYVLQVNRFALDDAEHAREAADALKAARAAITAGSAGR
jgi:hypothetical protein